MAAQHDITAQLATHDAAIGAMGGRIHGVEVGLRTLQGEVHQGFSALNTTLSGLNSKIDKLDAAPKFDFHKTVKTVTSLAVLFAMIAGGIIYITTSQTTEKFATQALTNQHTDDRLAEHGAAIKELADRQGWMPDIRETRRK